MFNGTALLTYLIHLDFYGQVFQTVLVGTSLEGFPSGQRDQTVNLTALPS